VLKNILSNWVGIVILGLIGIVLTPIMVHGLGNLYYGMWILAASIGDYSGLLDLGMRTTIFGSSLTTAAAISEGSWTSVRYRTGNFHARDAGKFRCGFYS